MELASNTDPGALAGTAGEDDWSFLSPPQQSDELGRLGPFRVLEVMGKGGMGVVFRAEDVSLHRPVALKAILPALACSKALRERFLREARAIAQVRHEHVVGIYQVGEERGIPFIAMELLQGEQLERRLKQAGRLSLSEILRVGREMAEGLAAAHESGLIHRDIKPDNVWLEGPGARVKLLDFGLVRAASGSELTQQGCVMGSPGYMSPEQALGKPLDHRSDLFSLGCVLYRMATGVRPFQGSDPAVILLALVSVTPRPPREVAPETPTVLSDLVMRLLDKDPEQRPSSARVVADALAILERTDMPTQALAPPESPSCKHPLEETLAPNAAPVSGPRPNAGPASRWPSFVSWVALLLLILVGGTGVVALALLRISTPDGEFQVEVADDDVAVAVDRLGGLKLKDSKTGREYRVQARESKTLPGGEYELVVTEKEGDFEFSGRTFQVKKKDEPARLRVWFVKKSNPVVQMDEPSKPTVQSHRKAAEWVLGLGGKVTISGREQPVAAVKDLPAGQWALRKVDLRYSPKVTDAGLKELAGLTDLEALLLSGTAVTDTGLAHLSGLKGLRELTLTSTAITNVGLAYLAGLKNLRVLELSNTTVTDAGLERLIELKDLQELVLTGVKVTDVGLRQVAMLKSLRLLSLSNTQVTDAGLTHLGELKSLEQLNLSQTKVTDAGVQHLSHCRSLRELLLTDTKAAGAGLAALLKLQALDLNRTPLTDAGLKELAGLKALESLSLLGTKVTDAGLKELTGLERLRSLNLEGTPVTDTGLAEMKDLGSLRWLGLRDTKVTDAGLKQLAGLKNLQLLQLSATNVTDEGLVHLRELSQLKILDLSDTRITAAGAATLRKVLPNCDIISSAASPEVHRKAAEWALGLAGQVTISGQDQPIAAVKDLPAGPWALRKINLHFNPKVTDAGLKELAGLTDLEALLLSGTAVTDTGLAHLSGLKGLRELTLTSTAITDVGLAYLAGLKNLRVLELSNTTVTDAGLERLAELKDMQELNLSKTTVTDGGLRQVAMLKSLRLLDLHNTQVTDGGLERLGGLKSLERLNLSQTKVTDAGVQHLSHCQSLRELLLTDTKATGAGLAALIKLQALDLNRTPVTDAGLKELAGLKALESLSLLGTKVTDAGLKELTSLERLRSLDLEGTPVTDAGVKDLQKVLPGLTIKR